MSVPERLEAALGERYRIERELGRGGMATVYLAEDLKHHRKVALKVLKPELAAVVGGERFLAEIETTANLTHPNVLPLFDSGEADSFLYYVMPYVAGETLRDRLDREKQLPVDEAVGIVREVADALHHAHERGVVHRDVKPANILLQDGRPVVADFGIALAVSAAGGGRLTETGLSLGTPHYMSPEQASGDRDVDPRTDVYSLGCVLYEMLTGEPPYGGGTAQAVLARILTGEVDRPTRIRSAIPPHVEGTVLKAMEKLPADRFESAAAFARALTDPSFRYGPGALTPMGSASRVWKAAAVVLAGLSLLLSGGLYRALTREPPSPPTTRSVFAVPPGGELGAQSQIALGRDGATAVYVGGDGLRLHLKSRSAEAARALAGTEGASSPSIDPSGGWVAYIADRELRKTPLAGGPSVTLADTAASEISGSTAWLDDGTIAYGFSDANGWALRRIGEGGGTPETLFLVNERYASAERNLNGWAQSLAALPDGEGSFLFVVCVGSTLCQEDSEVWVWDGGADEARPLGLGGALGAWYVAPGYVVLLRPSGAVFGTRFDLDELSVLGEPVPLFEGVRRRLSFQPLLAVAPSGRLLASIGGADGSDVAFHWIDRSGIRTPVDPDFSFRPAIFPSWKISPDGDRVAFGRITEGGADIWVKELDDGPAYRLTFDAHADYRPGWSPDGEWVLFVSERNGDRDLFRRRSNATGPVELVLDRERQISQGEWGPGGDWLVYREGTTEGRDVWALRASTDSVPEPLIADPGYDEKAATISPDGRWIAYESLESGRNEVYVRPFPAVAEGKWQISVGGGSQPLWAHHGREIFYVREDGQLVAATLDAGPPFAVTARDELFPTGDLLEGLLDHTSYDIHPDDERFIFAVPLDSDQGAEGYWLEIENWATALAEVLGER